MPAKEQSVRLPTLGFRGLDLRTNILELDKNAGRIVQNLVKDPSGRLTCRQGFQHAFRRVQTYQQQVFFPFTYTYFDPTMLTERQELLALGMAMDGSYANQGITLYKLTPATMTVGYSGTGTGTLTFQPHATLDGKWQLTVLSNAVSVLSTSYDDAFVSPSNTVQTFRAAVDGLATWSCTSLATADQNTPIDVLGPEISISLTNGQSTTVDYYALTTIGSLETTGVANFTDAAFVTPSFLNYSNVVYIAYGTYLYKYDGQKVYRAGLPQGAITSIADALTGSTFAAGETRIYKVVYSRVDYRGNTTEGEDSDDTLAVATYTMVGAKDAVITIPNLKASDYPYFNLRGAQINGSAVGVSTVTVDAGHTIEVGDTILIKDVSVSPAVFVERVVTVAGATSITFTGGAIDVTDNSVFSNNVRMEIWRTENNGLDFFLEEIIANDPFSTSRVHTDDTTDDDLGAQFVEQTRKHTLPPKCSYVGTHQNLMLLAGDPENPTRLVWNLPDAFEAFPLESNNIDLKTAGTGALTGFGTIDGDRLAVFKKTSHAVVTGDLDALNIRTLDRTYSGIGCTSFRSLDYVGADAETSVLVGLSLKGPFSFIDGEASLTFSEPIAALFPTIDYTQVDDTAITSLIAGATNNYPFALNRAIGFNDYLSKRYYLFIPAEKGTPSQLKYPSYSSSRWLVFDYGSSVRGWYDFSYEDKFGSSVGDFGNPGGGFTIYAGEIFFGGIHLYSGDNNIRADILKFKNTGDINDYYDGAHTINVRLNYIPITREPDDDTPFLKPLWVVMTRNPLALGEDEFNTTFELNYGSFSITVRTQHDFRNAIMEAVRSWDVENIDTIACKVPSTDKTRRVQIRICNEDALRPEVPSWDEVELIFCTPYDKKKKEPQQ